MTEAQITEEKKLEGLRGWLILVGLKMILSCLLTINELLEFFFVNLPSKFFWETFHATGRIISLPFITIIIFGAEAMNMVFVILWVYAGYLFFNKKKTFPKWFIGIMLFHIVFFITDSLLAVYAIPSRIETGIDYVILRHILIQTIITITFVSYVLVSKRVKATFVK
jgi:hypothetical protein